MVGQIRTDIRIEGGEPIRLVRSFEFGAGEPDDLWECVGFSVIGAEAALPFARVELRTPLLGVWLVSMLPRYRKVRSLQTVKALLSCIVPELGTVVRACRQRRGPWFAAPTADGRSLP